MAARGVAEKDVESSSGESGSPAPSPLPLLVGPFRLAPFRTAAGVAPFLKGAMASGLGGGESEVVEVTVPVSALLALS